MAEWVTRKIGSLGRIVTGKTPPTADPANFGGPYPFITIPDLDGRVAIDRTARTLSEKGAETMRSSLLPAGAVMMSCIATVGKCGVTTKPSFTNQQINSIIPTKETDPRFLYYVFTRLAHELESAGGGGSVYTNVSKSRFSDIAISLPDDLAEQFAIAYVLGALDDKIDLNRRMNETLEAIARAIFKSWFVDFDPVRAKRRGTLQRVPTAPGLPAHLADLFPDAFEDSPLGKMPKGWRVKAIGDVVRCVGGTTPSTKEPPFWDGDIAFATPKDLAALASPVLLRTERSITELGLQQISSGLLPAGTVLLSSRAPIGYLAISQIPVAVNQGFIAMVCDGELPNLYVLHWSRENADLIVANANGTTFLEISKSNFRPLKVLVPPPAVLEKFVSEVEPLYRQMANNLAQCDVLADLRDTLLPKLLSGEVRVKDAERIIAGHV